MMFLKIQERASLFLWTVATGILVNDVLFSVSLVKDNGMLPGLSRGDFVLVNKTWKKKIRTGTLVLIRNPEASRNANDLRLIRRVEVLDSFRYGKFNFLKDNRESEDDSRDSKDFGAAPEGIILGKVVCVAFPPWRWQWFGW